MCRIAKNNQANVTLVMSRLSDTEFSVYLPNLYPNQAGFFDMKSNSSLIIDFVCDNQNFITHRKAVEMKICRNFFKIKDIVAENNQIDLENLSVKYTSIANTIIVKLRALDSLEKPESNYLFTLAASNNYFDVSVWDFFFLKFL